MAQNFPRWILQALDIIDDEFVVLDRHWQFVYANRRALEQAREPREQLLGRSLWELYPELLGTSVETHYRRAMAEQTTVCFETPGIISGRWLAIHLYPNPDGLIIYCHDDTQRKLAEEALRERDGRFRQMAENLQEAFWITDPQFAEVSYVSPAYEKIWGRSCESLYEDPASFLEAVHPEDRQRIIAAHEKGLREGQAEGEYRIVRPDGSVRWIWERGFPVQDEQGKLCRMVGIAMDVTDRKRTAEALQESESRFQAFMGNSPAVAWMKDELLRFVYVNRTWEERFQKRLAEVRGLCDLEIRPAEVGNRLRQHDQMILSSGKAMVFEETVPDPDGRPHSWQVFKFPFQDGRGHQYVGGMAIDISERKAAEEKLREDAERMEALSRRVLETQEAERRHLARELHDEIGQLLTGLKLSLEVAARQQMGGGTQNSEPQRLVQELMRRVRDLSLDLRPSILDDLGLLPALTWQVERFRQQTGIRVVFEHQGVSGRFSAAVETAAFRIVQEALTNVARHAQVAEVCVRLGHTGTRLHVQVADHGAGFDPLQVPAGGSSGLSGMRERATLLGGFLSVDAQLGAGTQVSAELPTGDGPIEPA
jgi:PAS domain S-box-containing protein